MYWESYLTKNLQMTLNYQSQIFRRSSWPPGTCRSPDLCEHMYSLHGTKFNWHDPTWTYALLDPVHFTDGGTG